jgi:hypothetical protein
MRGVRLMASWVLALFLAAMFLWLADLMLLQPPANGAGPVFSILADSSGIAYFEPSGRLGVGIVEVVAALLLLLPFTRRIGAILGVLIAVGAVAMAAQLVMLGIKIPIPGKGEADAGGLLYLGIALLVLSLLLVFVHPGRAKDDNPNYYERR